MCSIKKPFKNFAIFIREHMFRSLFSVRLQAEYRVNIAHDLTQTTKRPPSHTFFEATSLICY